MNYRTKGISFKDRNRHDQYESKLCFVKVSHFGIFSSERLKETLLIEGVVIFTESYGYVKFYSTKHGFSPFFTGSQIFSTSRIK